MEIDDIYVDTPPTAEPPTAEQVIRRRNAEKAAKDAVERERENARRNAKEAATQHLIKSSLVAIGQEATAAVRRLKAKNWPYGRLQDVVVSYTPVYSGWIRKRIRGYFPAKEERAIWHIALDDVYRSSAHLGSDGQVYFFSNIMVDGRHYHKDYHPIDMSGNEFFNLSDDEIKDRVKRTIQELREIGLD